MDTLSVISIVGGTLLYIASAILTFKILEKGRVNPVAALYPIVKGIVLGAVCAFLPSILLLINSVRTGAHQELIATTLIAGFTIVLPIVYLVIVLRAIVVKDSANKIT